MNAKHLKARIVLYFFASVFLLGTWHDARSAIFDDSEKSKIKFVEKLQIEYPDADFLIESQGKCEGKFPQYVRVTGVTLGPSHPLIPKGYLYASNGAVQKLSVTQESGVYIVRWPSIGKTILDAMVNDLNVKYNVDSNFDDLVDKLFLSQSVRKATREMKYRYAMTIGSGIVNGPSHKPLNVLHLDDVTVRDALIKMVKIYHGVIFYSECPLSSGQTMYNIDYFERGYPNNSAFPVK